MNDRNDHCDLAIIGSGGAAFAAAVTRETPPRIAAVKSPMPQ
jgi:succinate dehydrogenase/fumarate reductase flavoprotein subunit